MTAGDGGSALGGDVRLNSYTSAMNAPIGGEMMFLLTLGLPQPLVVSGYSKGLRIVITNVVVKRVAYAL